MTKTKGLRSIPWGQAGDADCECIYDNGHQDPAAFLLAVQSFEPCDVPKDARQKLTTADVKHTRFRSMAPGEARAFGVDSGVMEVEIGQRGYPVTAVFV